MDILITIELYVFLVSSVTVNRTACLLESTEGWGFGIEKDEPKMTKEKVMAKIGYKSQTIK